MAQAPCPRPTILRKALSVSMSDPAVRLTLAAQGLDLDIADLRGQPRGLVGGARHIRDWVIYGRPGVIWAGHDLGNTVIGPCRMRTQALTQLARALFDLAAAPAPATLSKD